MPYSSPTYRSDVTGSVSSSGNDLNFSLSTGLGMLAGDLLLMLISLRASVTAPSSVSTSGWTELARRTSTGADTITVFFTRIANASDVAGASYTCSIGSGYTDHVLTVLAFTTGLYDPAIGFAQVGQQDSSGATVSAPSITTTIPNALLVTVHVGIVASGVQTWTPPGGMSERVDNQDGLLLVEVNTLATTTLGATGAKSATPTASTSEGMGFSLELQGIATGGTASWISGFELGSPHEAAPVTGSPTVATTNARTGYALRANPTAATRYAGLQSKAAGGTTRSIFRSARFVLRVDALPSANTTIISANNSIELNSDGTLGLSVGGSNVATSVNALTADATYHRIEWDVGWNAGAGMRIYVDGIQWATFSGAISAVSSSVLIGVVVAATADLYFDDMIFYSDDLGGSIADWKVILLKPTADSNRGNWTGGAGGTTNLWDALDNVPPAGLTAGSDTDSSQIQNAVSATYPATAAQLGQFTCQSYTTGGVGPYDTVLAVQAICNHGEGIATGTKPGGVFIVSNPAQGTLGDWFDYGNDAGAIGTWPFTTAGTPTRGWFTAGATPVATPSVTLGTQPVVGVFKDTASTRESHVAFLGIYVAYSPGLPPELMGRPDGLRGQQQMHQLLSQ